ATASARRSSGGGWSPRSIRVTDEASAIASAADLPEDFKGQLVPRPISSVDTLVVHQTGVLGGFGAESAEARRQRYRKTPYHVVYSPRDRASHWQWPIWAWSYHGHCLNAKSIGWAYDGLLSEGSPSNALDVEGARESLRHAVARAAR
ncbi:MAG: hypothetical protein HC927_00365, partial [Deltaproteobacteria bacterium]|nr:hypothetical protein [Deltaproteobacteria bacterium]